MRFTSSGYVRLEIGYAAGKVLFSVANTGPSLDKDMMHRVCQRYWESGKSAANSDGSDSTLFGGGEGIGLGLNISFNILQCLGSTLVMSRCVVVATTGL
jgi:signal transduction histidine kinase